MVLVDDLSHLSTILNTFIFLKLLDALFDVITKIAQLYGVSVGHILGIEWSPVSHKTLRKLYEIYLNEVNV